MKLNSYLVFQRDEETIAIQDSYNPKLTDMMRKKGWSLVGYPFCKSKEEACEYIIGIQGYYARPRARKGGDI